MTTNTTATTLPHLLLPGQAGAPDGPIDMTVMYVMHHGFRRDLHDLVRAVPATPIADRIVWTALGRRWQRLVAVLHHHQRVEDRLMWPRVRASTDDVLSRMTLDAMASEHTDLDGLLQACADGFRAMTRAPEERTRDRLATDLTGVRTSLLDHLEHEETIALPLVQQHVPVDVWRRAEREAAGDSRPSLQERYGDRDGYVARVRRAAQESVAARLLLPEDAERLVATAVSTSLF